ncbi:hypothetical protein EB796_016310 [Bugula neritina]|uniref:Uncharacterized protein n=1 Tax=Bugula neritina TaxID=10212 RepID=A0A7J7JHT2_BUGNE|nr:hypothetical protein EB796_016310 [Bugula neritina]
MSGSCRTPSRDRQSVRKATLGVYKLKIIAVSGMTLWQYIHNYLHSSSQELSPYPLLAYSADNVYSGKKYASVFDCMNTVAETDKKLEKQSNSRTEQIAINTETMSVKEDNEACERKRGVGKDNPTQSCVLTGMC